MKLKARSLFASLSMASIPFLLLSSTRPSSLGMLYFLTNIWLTASISITTRANFSAPLTSSCRMR